MATTFDLPTEGTIFRAVGDTQGDAVYKIVNGKLTTIQAPSYVANTAFRDPDTGITYQAGQVSSNPKNVQWLDPNYRGTATTRQSAASIYGQEKYNALQEVNMADLNSAIARGYAFDTGNMTVNANIPANAVNPNAGFQATGVVPQVPKPVTTLSSTNGQQVANQNIQKLQQMQSSYAGPSIVDYLKSIGQASDIGSRGKLATEAGIKDYQGSAEQNTQLLGLLRAPTSNPALAQTTNAVNQGIQSGNASPENIQSYTNAQDLQNSIFSDISLADAAKQSGDYSQMDYLIKRSEENTKLLNEQLSQLYKDMKPLREKQLQLMTPGAREQELAKQVNDIKGQVEQFKIQTEEDKFREFEGQTLGFAGGRASEIDIRAQFKLQRMAAEQNTLLTELGLEQNVREMQGKSVEQQLSWLTDDFELQQKVQEKITDSEDSVFEMASKLRGEAKDTLSMILDSMQGINPDTMPAQTRMQLQTLAAQSNVPLDIITAGLKVQYQRQVFEDSIKSANLKIQQQQEARLGSDAKEAKDVNQPTLLGAGLTQDQINAIDAGIKENGFQAVYDAEKAAGASPEKLKAIQDAYKVQTVQTKADIETDMRNLFTTAELKTMADELGYSSAWTGKETDINNMFKGATMEQLVRKLSEKIK